MRGNHGIQGTNGLAKVLEIGAKLAVSPDGLFIERNHFQCVVVTLRTTLDNSRLASRGFYVP